MLIQILSFLHNLTTLLFGIFISAFFLGVKQNYRNIRILSLFFCFEGLLYIVFFSLFGVITTDRLYAVLIHVPLILFLTLYYKYPPVSSCISVFSAYLCCQLSNWVGLLMLTVTHTKWCYYTTRIFITVLTFFLLCRFVCHTTEVIFAKNGRELYIIGILPTVYYLFDYAFTKLSKLLYSGNKVIIEFMGFVFCITYFTFLLVYFREYENRLKTREYSNLMEMQFLSVQKEIEQVTTSKEKLAILKHDMRHHLNIILTQLRNNNTEQALDYIQEITDSYDDTEILAYCRNEMINSVISIYHTRFTDNNIVFHYNISTGESLQCPDTVICTILSNALENCLHALEDTEIYDKWVRLMISQNENHLLLQIENPIRQIPKFVDGIPTSDRKGHGIGVKSIVHYVEELNGKCHFSVLDNSFILRIII